jgi:hypothetical protein
LQEKYDRRNPAEETHARILVEAANSENNVFCRGRKKLAVAEHRRQLGCL